MSILTALADYDGTRKEPLETILRTEEPTPALLGELVELSAAEDANVGAGATWLLRAWLESGVPIPADAVSSLAERLPEIGAQWARLHVCQSVRSLDIGPAEAPLFAAFLQDCRASDRPFLRAWATDGLYHLSRGHPAFQDSATAALEAALIDPAASVRARARRILDGK